MLAEATWPFDFSLVTKTSSIFTPATLVMAILRVFVSQLLALSRNPSEQVESLRLRQSCNRSGILRFKCSLTVSCSSERKAVRMGDSCRSRAAP